MTEAPRAHHAMLLALEEYLAPPTIVVIRGGGDEVRAWQQHLARDHAPSRFAVGIPDDAAALPGVLAEHAPRGDICAYVCHGSRCLPPVTTLAALDDTLRAE